MGRRGSRVCVLAVGLLLASCAADPAEQSATTAGRVDGDHEAPDPGAGAATTTTPVGERPRILELSTTDLVRSQPFEASGDGCTGRVWLELRAEDGRTVASPWGHWGAQPGNTVSEPWGTYGSADGTWRAEDLLFGVLDDHGEQWVREGADRPWQLDDAGLSLVAVCAPMVRADLDELEGTDRTLAVQAALAGAVASVPEPVTLADTPVELPRILELSTDTVEAGVPISVEGDRCHGVVSLEVVTAEGREVERSVGIRWSTDVEEVDGASARSLGSWSADAWVLPGGLPDPEAFGLGSVAELADSLALVAVCHTSGEVGLRSDDVRSEPVAIQVADLPHAWVDPASGPLGVTVSVGGERCASDLVVVLAVGTTYRSRTTVSDIVVVEVDPDGRWSTDLDLYDSDRFDSYPNNHPYDHEQLEIVARCTSRASWEGLGYEPSDGPMAWVGVGLWLGRGYRPATYSLVAPPGDRPAYPEG